MRFVFDTNVLVSGKAGVIVTGDSDLLVLNPFREIAILNPKDFLENYKLS